ncbi:Serine-type D-Ala-D-Ala carboxypeptidase [Candidatus Glomeribacter gigasporarum BEG34]|uniref:serine-type D-Ala-D-Ala carboxypeptidase n=1 Tax=Candidatus Glomeribacter gigasporarum BEG34 TaxID=1070319 RepID=G2JB20_9BURK|nr:Serine-type D-Ala-D-Ala carboxypeptidase [Candidatus Glomeribacter gigasporarum BEG34]
MRGRIHRAARGGTCSARIDPHTVFALAPWAISLKNALVAAPLVFFSAARAQLPPPAVLAPSWVLVDASSHQILASAHSEQRVEPASLTKLMTSYLVFQALKDKRISMEQTVVPGESIRRVGRDESRMFLEADKAVSVHDLVYGMIVQSGNDAAIALAELLGGSEANFVAMMNRAARRLGMTHTHYADVNGMPDPQHYTSARDVAILSARLMQDFPEYYSIFSIKEYTYNKIRQPNRNRLLWLDPSVDGLKTGHTQSAGYSLAVSARRPLPAMPEVERRLVSVVVSERRERDRVQDSLKLLNYGYQAYEMIRLYAREQAVDTPRIYKGAASAVKIGVLADRMVTVPRGESNNIKLALILNQPLIAPVSRGQKAGIVKVMVDGKQITRFPVVVLEDISQAGLFGRLLDSVRFMFQQKSKKN